MADWKDILSDSKEQLSDEDLLKYLDTNTPEKEKYAIEKKLADASFESDAVDGLQQLKNPEQVKNHVNQLNQKLRQHLVIKKHRKQKRNITDFQWTILALLILLFVCIMGYLVIHLS